MAAFFLNVMMIQPFFPCMLSRNVESQCWSCTRRVDRNVRFSTFRFQSNIETSTGTRIWMGNQLHSHFLRVRKVPSVSWYSFLLMVWVQYDCSTETSWAGSLLTAIRGPCIRIVYRATRAIGFHQWYITSLPAPGLEKRIWGLPILILWVRSCPVWKLFTLELQRIACFEMKWCT